MDNMQAFWMGYKTTVWRQIFEKHYFRGLAFYKISQALSLLNNFRGSQLLPIF